MLDAHSTPQVPQAVRLADYRPPDWLVPAVRLDFDLDAARTVVRARLEVVRNGAHDRPLVLDGEALELLALQVDGVAVPHPNAGTLTLALDGDRAVIETEVAIAPAANTQLMGLYASGGKLCTQCEAEGFRRITYFPDRPDVLSRYSVRLTADAGRYPVLLANGNLASRPGKTATGTGRSGTIPGPSRATCSPPSPATCRPIATASSPRRAAPSSSPSGWRRRTCRAARMRWRR